MKWFLTQIGNVILDGKGNSAVVVSDKNGIKTVVDNKGNISTIVTGDKKNGTGRNDK